MKRNYKQHPRFNLALLGKILFTTFILFIAYRILTPPSNETARTRSPDGTKTASLRIIYYLENQPSYKIYYREAGTKTWESLFRFSGITNIPQQQAEADIRWSKNSKKLHFMLNGTSIWYHAFTE